MNGKAVAVVTTIFAGCSIRIAVVNGVASALDSAREFGIRPTHRSSGTVYRRHVDVFELQGCGAGIVYLTAFAAVNVYDLVGVGVGLGLMVGLVVLQL